MLKCFYIILSFLLYYRNGCYFLKILHLFYCIYIDVALLSVTADAAAHDDDEDGGDGDGVLHCTLTLQHHIIAMMYNYKIISRCACCR